MTKSEAPLMLAHPCTSLYVPVCGSTKHVCTKCRRLVWITPASLRIVEREGCVIFCVACAADVLPDEDVEVQPLNAEQEEEFKRG